MFFKKLLEEGGLQNQYRKDISDGLSIQHQPSKLTIADLDLLPGPVKRYIIYSGSLGKPKVNHFYIEFSGQLRKNAKSSWMSFVSEQHNFMDFPTRLFFMRATMNHMPVSGYHRYKNGDASMDIRLFSLFKVQYQSGPEISTAETVTFFNDMCCMAPATLIDKRIEWGNQKGNEVEAKFTVNSITISATLYFNYSGQLVNFISSDRYALQEDGTMRRQQWSTPLYDYREINGYLLAGSAETVYTCPEGDFCYGRFNLRNVSCNS